MEPSEVLERVLSDHRELRGLLVRVERAAHRVLAGRSSAEDLRALLSRLLERLREHLAYEDDVLVSALAHSDGWSETRVERVHEDHARQRALFDEVAGFAASPGPPAILALGVLGLVVLLREDMDDEERVSVNEDVLRDDVIDPTMATD